MRTPGPSEKVGDKVSDASSRWCYLFADGVVCFVSRPLHPRDDPWAAAGRRHPLAGFRRPLEVTDLGSTREPKAHLHEARRPHWFFFPECLSR